jgi:hypothetical protein
MNMNDKPVALDLFCRMGGATVGYQRAGFYVIGVDIEPQPGYPGDEFVQADVIEYLEKALRSPSWIFWAPTLIHASPPCQEGNTATAGNRARGIADTHVQLVPPTRALLERIGIPYVIEQPTSSRAGLIRRDVTLCMDMFKGELPPPWVQKHRSFELGGMHFQHQRAIIDAAPAHPEGPVRGGSMVGFPKPAGHATRVRGHRHGATYPGDYVAAYGNGGGKATAAEAAHAMGITWMQGKARERDNRFDLYEAIPPAYTEWLGRQILAIR